MSKDINIKQLSYDKNSYDATVLKLEIDGNKIDYSIMNSLRKVIINQIPIYGFHTSKINILRNSSVYDSTEMKLRLSQLPINSITPNVIYLSNKYYKNVNFSDMNIEKHPDDNINVEIYINIKNNGPEKIRYVTTNDMRININNEVIENKKMYSEKNPIVLTMLRIGEEFECSMKSVLCVGEQDSIFNSSNSYYEEITPNKYYLYVESNGQMSEYKLLERGIEIIIEKLKLIKNNLSSDQYSIILTDNNSLILEITNEDFTCGGPLNYILQNMSEVVYSGVNKPDYMQKNVSIKLKVENKYKPIDILNKGIDDTIELYEQIKKKMKDIRGLK